MASQVMTFHGDLVGEAKSQPEPCTNTAKNIPLVQGRCRSSRTPCHGECPDGLARQCDGADVARPTKLLDLVRMLVLCSPWCSRVKLQALPGSRCDGLRTVLEQYFRHAWFFRHAVLESCRVGLSGSVHVAAAAVEGGEGRGGGWRLRGSLPGSLPGQVSAAFCGADLRRLFLGLDSASWAGPRSAPRRCLTRVWWRRSPT